MEQTNKETKTTKEKRPNRVLVGIGSNIRPEHHIGKVKELLEANYSIVKWSKSHTTPAMDVPDSQPDFVNCACLLETSCSWPELRTQLKDIERQLGREPNSSDAPRCIDMDILIWNGAVVDKDVYMRPFLKYMIVELLPELRNLFIFSETEEKEE